MMEGKDSPTFFTLRKKNAVLVFLCVTTTNKGHLENKEPKKARLIFAQIY